MTRLIAKLADSMLSRLVPVVRAEAGCVTDPYSYTVQCGCNQRQHTRYAKLCQVHSNCSVTCTTCQPYAAC